MKKSLLLLFSFFIFFLSQAQQPFITTWEVTAGDLDITIPTNTDDYTYDYTIDLGDGTVLNNQTGDVTHTYASAGTYTVSISGLFPHFYSVYDFNNQNEKLKTVEQWGDNVWQSMEGAFYYCVNMNLNTADVPDLSQVSSMKRMFERAFMVNYDIDNWDVSNVNDMSFLFYDCESFNQPLNNWNVSNVTNMDYLFRGAIFFDQPLDNWDTSNVTKMQAMFYGASSFDQPLDNWDVSNVNNMSFLFYDCESFNQPLNNWNVSNVTNMDYLFGGAIFFDQPLDNWDTSNVTKMEAMFNGASSFDQPLDNWDVTSVTPFFGFAFMFRNASSFNQNLSDWEFSNGFLPNFLSNSGISTTNYDLLIEQLVNLNINNGILGAAGIKYCDAFSRQQLINAGWSINDGGLASDCDLNYVSGQVSYDEMNDGCDSGDIGLSDYLINANNGSEDAGFAIDENGQYLIPLDSGNYTLSLLNLNANFTATPSTQSINFSGQSEIIEDTDFCVTADQTFDDLSVSLLPLEVAIPGFETTYQLVVNNDGSQTATNVQTTFAYDENFQSFVSATETPSGNTTNLLTFDFVDVDPFSSEIFEITMLNAVPPTLNVGEVLSFTAQVTPDINDTNPDNNTAVHDQTVVNSFDPNDKMVVQGDQIVDEDIDQYLNYRIRFQNLGTANALNVKITDTIDNNLDWTTFQPISSSHDYRIEIVNGEQINYYFDNINLPYEDADAEGSNGYITYKIKPKSSVQIGDTFENTAYIYFDFNLPILTNTVVTTVVDNLDVNTFDFNGIDIYPNPVKDKLNINLPADLQLNSMELFDIQGRRVKVFNNQSELNFSTIQKGVYLLKFDTDRGGFHKKIIKK